MRSLKSRLLISSIIGFIVFAGITGIVLDKYFRTHTYEALKLRLHAELFDLEKNADKNLDGDLDTPTHLSSTLSQPRSGHYAAIAYNQKIVWYSPSNHGIKIPYHKNLRPGERIYSVVEAEDGSNLFMLSYGYLLIDGHDNSKLYIFNVAESDYIYNNKVTSFRHGLWGWVGIILLFLLVSTGIILSWGLRPLAKVKQDLLEIEDGKREYLDNYTIEEIDSLTIGLNTLLKSERARQERYKNSLGDLAHSFKTPLAIIKSTINNETIEPKIRETLSEQTDTLNELVTYQLRRAQTAGTSASLSKPINIEAVVTKICNALSKVYSVRNIQVIKDIDPNSVFYGDEGDLLELLGNLLDNAHKWAAHQVRITVQQVRQKDEVQLTMLVEDDGHGIPQDKKSDILKRGIRADQHTPGHGIGMSIIGSIIEAYGGELQVQDSDMGGAKFKVSFKR